MEFFESKLIEQPTYHHIQIEINLVGAKEGRSASAKFFSVAHAQWARMGVHAVKMKSTQLFDILVETRALFLLLSGFN